MAKKHQKILDYIYAVIDALDKTGQNTERYKQHFENMSEEEFQKEMKYYITTREDNFTVELDPFEQNITAEEIDRAGKIANVKMQDYLVLPEYSDDPDDPVVTKHEVRLYWLNQRRVQQTLETKNHLSTGMDKRNPKTNQVIDDDKNARVSDMEMYQLLFQDAKHVLAEQFGPKADDLVMLNEMLHQIQRKGSVSLDELPNNIKNKTSLMYLNYILLAAGYDNDLISPDGLLPIVAERGGKLYSD